ncbi:hypothetical protein [Bradyrhizobium diazoefficiens]
MTQTPKTLAQSMKALRESAGLATLSQRLEYVGVELFGPHGWTGRLAKGLGIGRTMLWHYRNGDRPDRDVDGMLLDLIDRERDAAAARVTALTALRNRMLVLIGRARRQEKRDAA